MLNVHNYKVLKNIYPMQRHWKFEMWLILMTHIHRKRLNLYSWQKGTNMNLAKTSQNSLAAQKRLQGQP